MTMMPTETKRIAGIIQEFTQDYFISEDARIIAVMFEHKYGEDIRRILCSHGYTFMGWEQQALGISFFTFFRDYHTA